MKQYILYILIICSGSIRAQESETKLTMLDSLNEFYVYNDIAYGDHERQKFDLLLPDKEGEFPLVIFIHGGGFRNGDKQQAFEKYMNGIKKLLKNKIAFASINYRFLEHSDNGVKTCLNDGKYCLQHLRFNSEKYNIDPDKIVAFGESAGAGMSLWLGLNDDMADHTHTDSICHMSSRLLAAGAFAAQSTYDILRWEEVFEDWDVSFDKLADPFKQPIVSFYGADSFEELKTEPYKTYRKDLDFFELMSSDDPPIWVRNNSGDGHPLFFDSQHHPLHAKYLKKYAEKAGIDHSVFAPALDILDESEETLMDFFLRILSN